VCVAWTGLVGAVLAGPAGRGELRPRGRAPSRAALAGGAAAVALALGFGAVAAASSVSRLDLVRFVDDRTAFAAASVVCGLAGAALAAAVAALLQRAARAR